MDINIIFFLVFILILVVVGIVGNFLIIVVYYFNVRKLFNRYYIVVFFIIDLVVNFFIIFYMVIFEFYDVISDVVCYGMEVIRYIIIGFFNFILVLIVCECLFLIWKLIKFVFEKIKLGVILGILGVFVIIGILLGVVYEVIDRVFDVEEYLNIIGIGELFC